MVNAEALQHAQSAGVLRAEGQLHDALAEYQQTLKLQPDFALAHCGIGEIYDALGNSAAAIQHYEQAIILKPDLALAQNNLGVLYHAAGRFDEAIACYAHALTQTPDDAKLLHNMGDACLDKGELNQAGDFYARALTVDPKLAHTRYSIATLQLLQGDFAHGWQNYDARFQSGELKTAMRSYNAPVWNGEKVNGPILIWGEQGIGDEVMFAGLIPDVIAAKNNIILDCANARLQLLFQRSFPNVRVITGTDPGAIAAHLPIGSLPKLFRTSANDFKKTTSPYLIADSAIVTEFKARYSTEAKKIGLAWQTHSKKTGQQRSVPLVNFAPLFFARPNVKWINLQYGDVSHDIAEIGAPLFTDPSVDQFKDIDRFAAQIAALDLVITIDNATAHLAGALGIPTWLLLPATPDWRWLLGRSDSPWYPSVRLFRQSAGGGWDSVIRALTQEISVHLVA